MPRATRRLLALTAAFGVCLGFASIEAAVGPSPVPDPSAQQQKKTAKGKTKPKKGAPAASPDPTDAPATKSTTGAASPGGPSFARDIAPILVANCTNCHNATHRSGLNQTTFEGLMKGGKSGKAVVGGKPEESLILARVKGEEGAKMPPGQNNLSPATIEKIEAWIKNGAILDAGVQATAALNSYAPTADDLRRQALAKMPTAERDKKTEAVGLERIKKVDDKAEIVVQKGSNFLLFSNMPKERGAALLKSLDGAGGTVKLVLGSGAKTALAGPEKVSLYVFKNRAAYVEFVRSIENQEVDDKETSRSKLTVDSPYVIAIDPLAFGTESLASAGTPKKKGSSKSKKSAAPEEGSGPERSLNGILTEALTSGATAQAGAPAWIASGFGAYLAAQSEPRSRYYGRVRADAMDLARVGWPNKATEALGGQASAASTRAVGFALFEFMAANGSPQLTTGFVQTMLGGQAKLDDAIRGCFGMSRDEFLGSSAEWMYAHYPKGR